MNHTPDITFPRIAQALTITAHRAPALYAAMRTRIDPEHLPILDFIIGGEGGVDDLDKVAGYPPKTPHHDA